jgi:hypothetical protein
LSASDLTAFANEAIVRLQRTYPIGGIRKSTPTGYFYADTLEGAVQASHPAIFDVEGVGTDVALGAGEVAILDVAVVAVHIVDTEVH